MTKNWVITPATAEDIPELEKLVNSAYRGETSKKGWTTEADLLDGIRIDQNALRRLMGNPGSLILKCTNADGDIIGCVHLQKQNSSMYLGMLTVSPLQQARGVGKLLLDAAEKHALQQGFSMLTMTVISERKELIAWYERRGYYRTGGTEAFPDDPAFGIPRKKLEFIVMGKSIK